MTPEVLALCFDVDGTLINDEKAILPDTILSINRMVEKFGCRVILASSRMPRSLRAVEAELGIECELAAYDGSMCVGIVHGREHVFADEKIRGYGASILEDITLNDDLFCGIFDGEEWIVSATGRWLDRELRSTKVQPDIVDEGRLRARFEAEQPLSKIMFRGVPERVAEVRVHLAGLQDKTTFHSNKDTILEYLPAKASKAAGISRIVGGTVEHLPGVIAFGDGYNDIQMLQAAEFSVAMGNAVEACRVAAEFQTADNNSGGIAMFLNRFL